MVRAALGTVWPLLPIPSLRYTASAWASSSFTTAFRPTLPRARGLALPRPGPHLLLDLTPHRYLRLRVQNWTQHPTNLPLLQGPPLSKDPWLYTPEYRAEPGSTVSLLLHYLLFYLLNILSAYLSHPCPSPPYLQLPTC